MATPVVAAIGSSDPGNPNYLPIVTDAYLEGDNRFAGKITRCPDRATLEV